MKEIVSSEVRSQMIANSASLAKPGIKSIITKSYIIIIIYPKTNSIILLLVTIIIILIN